MFIVKVLRYHIDWLRLHPQVTQISQTLTLSPSSAYWDTWDPDFVSIVRALKHLIDWFCLHHQGTEIFYRLPFLHHRGTEIFYRIPLSSSSGFWDNLQTPFVSIIRELRYPKTPFVSTITVLRYPTDFFCLHHQDTEISYRFPLYPPSRYWDILHIPFVSTITVLRYPTNSLCLHYQGTEISYKLPLFPPSGYWDIVQIPLSPSSGTEISQRIISSPDISYTDFVSNLGVLRYLSILRLECRSFSGRLVYLNYLTSLSARRNLTEFWRRVAFKNYTLFHVLIHNFMNHLHSRTIIWDIPVDNKKLMADMLLNTWRNIMSTFILSQLQYWNKKCVRKTQRGT